MSYCSDLTRQRIMACAKEEFLQVGFQAAQLQNIVKAANVTTGALYRHFKNKEDLFDAIVGPILQKFKVLEDEICKRNYSLMDNDALKKMWNITDEFHTGWIDFFYDNYDDMRLLLCCSEGTKHTTFIHDFAELNTQLTMTFVNEAKQRGLAVSVIDSEKLHILMTAYWSAMFETIIHGFTKEDALSFVVDIEAFFNWEAIFGF